MGKDNIGTCYQNCYQPSIPENKKALNNQGLDVIGGVDGAPLKLQNNQLKQVTNFGSLDASVSQWCITIKAREGTTFRAALKTELSRLTFGKEVRVDWEKRDK